MADALKTQHKSAVIVLAATDEGKVSLVVAVTEDLVGKVNAVDLVKRGAEALGGRGGGGRPDMAQAVRRRSRQDRRRARGHRSRAAGCPGFLSARHIKIVIPAKAGIQSGLRLDPRVRGDDG